MDPTEQEFALSEIRRWVKLRYARPATKHEVRYLRRKGLISQAFVAQSGGRLRLVIDYRIVNAALEDRSFRMDQLGDLAAVLQPGDSLFKADLKDGYYHLRIRTVDQMRLAYEVGGQVYLPLALNCGLKVAPWFFTRFDAPCGSASAFPRTPCLFVSGRHVRRSSVHRGGRPGRRDTQPGILFATSVRAPRSLAAPAKARLLGYPQPGNTRNRRRYVSPALPPEPGENRQAGDDRDRTTSQGGTNSPTYQPSRPPPLYRTGELCQPGGGRRPSAITRNIHCHERCPPGSPLSPPTRRGPRLGLVESPRVKPTRGPGHLGSSGRDGAHRRESDGMGTGVEFGGPSVRLVRRRERGSSHQRTGAHRGDLRAGALRRSCPFTAYHARFRLPGDGTHRPQYDIKVSPPPRQASPPPAPLRVTRGHSLYSPPPIGAQHLGRPVVPTTRLIMLGSPRHMRAPPQPALCRPAFGSGGWARSPRTRPVACSDSVCTASVAGGRLGAMDVQSVRHLARPSVALSTLVGGGPRARRPGVSMPRLARSPMAQRNARLWAETGTQQGLTLFGSGPGSREASELLTGSLAQSTQSNYQRLWDRFISFCAPVGLCPLPATPSTVCRYIGHLFNLGNIQGQSLRPYVAALGTQHRRHGLADPTADSLVKEVRAGYRALDSQRRSGPPVRSAPVPASVALACLLRALQPCDHATFTRDAAVAFCFLVGTRSESLLNMRREDIACDPTEAQFQVIKFKGGGTGVVPRLSLRYPLSGPGDILYRFVGTLQRRTDPRSWLFPSPTGSGPMSRAHLLRATSMAIDRAGATPPLGMKFTPRSLRSGGLSALYSTGVRKELVMRIANHAGSKILFHHYVDPLVRSCTAARRLFGRFSPHPQAALPLRRLSA